MTKSVESNSNSGLVTATINSNYLELNYQSNKSGTAIIVIKGTSNGKTVTDTFALKYLLKGDLDNNQRIDLKDAVLATKRILLLLFNDDKSVNTASEINFDDKCSLGELIYIYRQFQILVTNYIMIIIWFLYITGSIYYDFTQNRFLWMINIVYLCI